MTIQTVYQYDKDGFYLGEAQAFNGLMPNNSTAAQPALQEGFIPQWTGKEWMQVEDHKRLEGWLDGEPYTIKDYGPLPKGFSTEPPEPTLEEKQAAIVGAVQARLDAFAQARGYDGILSAATYATSTNAQFAAEGKYAVEARDLTWAKCWQILNDVMSGQRPEPSLEEILSELPALTWPEV